MEVSKLNIFETVAVHSENRTRKKEVLSIERIKRDKTG